MMLINQVHPDVVASDALSLALSPRTQPAERGVESPNADRFPRAFRACSGGFRFTHWDVKKNSLANLEFLYCESFVRHLMCPSLA
jgi:hypothetical protein